MVAARQMLVFTPCDLFPWIKGRTLWLVGDSIQQAGSYGSEALPGRLLLLAVLGRCRSRITLWLRCGGASLWNMIYRLSDSRQAEAP